MKKILKKTISVILNILITIVLLMLVLVTYNYVQTKMMKKEYTNFFGYTVFNVVTGSMLPTINVGDIIFVDIKDDQDIFNEQDIVVFKQDNAIITHRIVEIDEDKIITRGDANNTIDEPIKKEDIIGKVIKIIPNVEIWKKVFTSPEVFISAITTVILFGFAFSYDGKKIDDNKRNISSEEKKENNKEDKSDV